MMGFPDGTPPRRIYAERADERDIHEMLGMVKGLVCDGVLNDEEIMSFRRWLQLNSGVTVTWPGRDLADRIVRIFEDGQITDHERHDLYEFFCDTVGDGGPDAFREAHPSQLPLDRPPPTVIFENSRFCFTGIFLYGTRNRCEQAVRDRAGIMAKDILCRRDEPGYLVIGTMPSPAWIQSGWGRKVEAAVEARELGLPMYIVSEKTWAFALSLDEQ